MDEVSKSEKQIGDIGETILFAKPRIMEDEKREIVAPGGWGCRHTMALLTFCGSIVSYILRINLSMAIVAMVGNVKKEDDVNLEVCPHLMKANETTKLIIGEFDWDGEHQGILLGAFFWGYVLTQVPAGILSEKFGAKWVFGGGIFIAALFGLLTPLAARWGLVPLIIVRIIQGLGEGVTPPATHALLAQWSPPLERSKLGAFVYAGNQAGTMSAMLISAAIINENFLGGWPGVFYTTGLIGMIWFLFWCFFVYSKPSDHPRISKEELAYIEGALGGQTSKRSVPTPWKKIFTSLPVWAILITQTGNGWGLYTLLTELPTYMSSVLRYDMKSNGLVSAMPYFFMLVSGIAVSQFGDVLRSKKIWSTVTTRNVFNTLGHWGPAVALVGVAYSGCDRTLAVVLLTVAVGLSGCVGAGYQINHVDIAPNHAGVLMGICNGVANLAGIAAPYVAGVIIKDKGSLSNWKLVFLISAVIYFIDNLVFLIFASGEVQPWNDPEEETQDEEKVKQKDAK